MEQALKPKYSTRELKKDIIETAETVLENRERIKKVEASVSCIDAHITRHEDKIDPKIHNHHVILFGDHGDSGLCATTKALEKEVDNMKSRLDKYDANISKIVWMVAGTLLASILSLIIKIPLG